MPGESRTIMSADKDVKTENWRNIMAKKMNNDYTMGGMVTAQNWTQFKAVCKEHGINCGNKKFNELAMELSAILSAKTAPAQQKEFAVSKTMGEAIIRRIMIGGKDRNGKQHSAAMFMATKSKDPETNGKYMVTMKKLYAIIADVYGLKEGDPANDDFIKKGVINYLCRNGWLAFRQYDTGGMTFFPTVKMAQYKLQ